MEPLSIAAACGVRFSGRKKFDGGDGWAERSCGIALVLSDGGLKRSVGSNSVREVSASSLTFCCFVVAGSILDL